MGGGLQLQTEYRSVIYYHEDKPRWNETFKVAIPIDDFKVSHLLFTFKHRYCLKSYNLFFVLAPCVNVGSLSIVLILNAQILK